MSHRERRAGWSAIGDACQMVAKEGAAAGEVVVAGSTRSPHEGGPKPRNAYSHTSCTSHSRDCKDREAEIGGVQLIQASGLQCICPGGSSPMAGCQFLYVGLVMPDEAVLWLHPTNTVLLKEHGRRCCGRDSMSLGRKT